MIYFDVKPKGEGGEERERESEKKERLWGERMMERESGGKENKKYVERCK